MSGPVYRLSVHADGGCAVDLVLPAMPPVAELLPTIVELTGSRPEPSGWRLTRLDGSRLDESISLCQNRIADGDLLVLAQNMAPPRSPRRQDTVELTASAAPSDQSSSAIPRLVFLWAVLLTAVITCWHGGNAAGSVLAVVCSLAAFGVARINCYDRPVTLVLVWAAIILAASAGFLAVPSAPCAPNVLLGAAAATAAALVASRVYPGALSAVAATVGCCMPIALTAALATVRQLPTATLGAALSLTALTMLSAAPRLALAAAGLTPDTHAPHRAARAHDVLSGLIMGSAVAVALGASGVAVGSQRPAALVFGWLLATTILLRVLSFIDAERRWALTVSGLLCATAAFAATSQHHPDSAAWLSGALLAAGVAVLRCGVPGAAARRTLAHTEMVALALLVPSALWVGDFYATVRGG